MTSQLRGKRARWCVKKEGETKKTQNESNEFRNGSSGGWVGENAPAVTLSVGTVNRTVSSLISSGWFGKDQIDATRTHTASHLDDVH